MIWPRFVVLADPQIDVGLQFIDRDDRRLSWFDFAVVGLALYICILSVSQAALGTCLLLLAVMLVLHSATIHVRPVFAGLGLVLLLFLALDGQLGKYISKLEAVSAVEHRYTRTLEREKSELEVRGYDRIWHHPEYLVTGAGDSSVSRFLLPFSTKAFVRLLSWSSFMSPRS